MANKTNEQIEKENKAFQKGLNDKDYTWGDGFIDAINIFKSTPTEGEIEAFQKGVRARMTLDKENELKNKAK